MDFNSKQTQFEVEIPTPRFLFWFYTHPTLTECFFFSLVAIGMAAELILWVVTCVSWV